MATIAELIGGLNSAQNSTEAARAALAQALTDSDKAIGTIAALAAGAPNGTMLKIMGLQNAAREDARKALLEQQMAAKLIQDYIVRLHS